MSRSCGEGLAQGLVALDKSREAWTPLSAGGHEGADDLLGDLIQGQVTEITREGMKKMYDPPGTHVDIVACEGPPSLKPLYKGELGEQTKMKEYFITDRTRPEYEDPEWVDQGVFVTEVTSIDPASGRRTLLRRQAEPGAFVRPKESVAFTVSDCTIVQEPDGRVVNISPLHVEMEHGYSADLPAFAGGSAGGSLWFPAGEIKPGDSWQTPNSTRDAKNSNTYTFLGYANVQGRVCMEVRETSRANWNIPVQGPSGTAYYVAAHLLSEATYYFDYESGRVHRKETAVRATVDSDVPGFGVDDRVYRSVAFVVDERP